MENVNYAPNLQRLVANNPVKEDYLKNPLQGVLDFVLCRILFAMKKFSP